MFGKIPLTPRYRLDNGLLIDVPRYFVNANIVGQYPRYCVPRYNDNGDNGSAVFGPVPLSPFPLYFRVFRAFRG